MYFGLEECARICLKKGRVQSKIYTGCPRRNVPNFGRVFLMLNYTDITQTEIMAREV